MAKYNSLRPTMANWPKVPRKLLFAVALVSVFVVTCHLVSGILRSLRLSKIYELQASIANKLDEEMKYLEKQVHSDEDSWLPVVDLDGHVYSAYLDVRPEVIDHYSRKKNDLIWSIVRIIAILPTNTNATSVVCVFKYDKEHEAYADKRRFATSIKAIEDNWSLKYSAFFVICDLELPENYDNYQIPKAIAIGHPKTYEFNFVDLHYPIGGVNQLYEPANNFLAVCVPVFHHSYDRPLDLVEFIEYYLQLGASHLTFYNSSVTSDVSRVLDYYKKRKIATVLKWQLSAKYVYEKTLRHEGFFASLNDCLYRNAFHENYEYVANFGIDEFLMPRKHENFVNLIDYLDPYDEHKDGRYASFIFRNVFFYTMYENDRDNKDDKAPYLYTQAKTWRLEDIHEAGERSRYIVRGRDAVELGNYRVVELRKGSSTFTKPFEEIAVETEVALSHQYAPCEAEDTGCYLKPIVIDRKAHRFTKKLGIRVASACNDIFGVAGCPFVKKQRFA